MKDPFKYDTVSLINQPTRTIINETIDTKKAYRGTNSSLLKSNAGSVLLGFGQPDKSGGFVDKRGNTTTITSKPLNPESPVYAIYEQAPGRPDVYQLEPIYKTLDRSILLNKNRRTLLPRVTQVSEVKPDSSYSFSRDPKELDWESPFRNNSRPGTKSSTSKFRGLRNSYSDTRNY